MTMRVKPLGVLREHNMMALYRAKSHPSPHHGKEIIADCLIRYKGDVAEILPLPVRQSVLGWLLPNFTFRNLHLEISSKPIPSMVTSGQNPQGGSFGASSWGNLDPNTDLNFINTYTVGLRNSSGELVSVVTGTVTYYSGLRYSGDINNTRFVYSNYISGMGAVYGIIQPGVPKPANIKWAAFTGYMNYSNGAYQPTVGEWVSLGYEEMLAADVAAGTGGEWIQIVASDGSVIHSSSVELHTDDDSKYVALGGYNGQPYFRRYRYHPLKAGVNDRPYSVYEGNIQVEVPADCVGRGDGFVQQGADSIQLTSTLNSVDPIVPIATVGGTLVAYSVTYHRTITISGNSLATIEGSATYTYDGRNSVDNATSWVWNKYAVAFEGGQIGAFRTGTQVGASANFVDTPVYDMPEYRAQSPQHANEDSAWALAFTNTERDRNLYEIEKCNEDLKAMMNLTYVLSPYSIWRLYVRHPGSAKAYRPILDEHYDDVVLSNTRDAENFGAITTSRTVTLSYTIKVNGEDVVRSAQFVGTKVETRVKCEYLQNISSYITCDYDNWYLLASGEFYSVSDTKCRRTRGGVAAASNTFLTRGQFLSGRVVDSPYIPYSDLKHAWTASASTASLAVYYNQLNMAPRSTDLTISEPEFVSTYMKEVPIGVKGVFGQNNYLSTDSIFADGEQVGIAIYSMGDKAFSHIFTGNNFTDTDVLIKVYGMVTFSYTKATESFKVVSWKPANDDKGEPLGVDDAGNPIPRVFTLWKRLEDVMNIAQSNSVVTYIGLAWPDVVEAAKEANKALKQPEEGQPDNRTDEQMFIALVLSAFV